MSRARIKWDWTNAETDWIDCIDPATGRRTTLTTTGDALAAVLDRSGRLLTPDDQDDLVLRDPMTGRMLAMVASNATLKGASDASFSSSDVSGLTFAQAGESIIVVNATNVPYHDNVTGNTTALGLVLVRFHDHL